MKQHFALSISFAACALSHAATITYMYQDLGTLGGNQSIAHGINNRGWVVGRAQTADGVWHPFRYRPRVGTEQLSMNSGAAYDVNEAGVVVGAFYTQTRAIPFVRPPGQRWTVVGNLSRSEAFAINDSGQIVGNAGLKAFLYTPGEGVTTIDVLRPFDYSAYAFDINNAGYLTGISEFEFDNTAFLYHSDTGLSTFACYMQCYPFAINDAGWIAGAVWTGRGDNPYTAFLRSPDGAYTEIPRLPGGLYSAAGGINELGWVVGHTYGDNPGGRIELRRAFLYKPEQGVAQDLNNRVAPFGGILVDADDINDRGQIAGTALIDGQQRAFLLTPIRNPQADTASTPEPSTLLLLGTGLGAIICSGCRNRRMWIFRGL